MNAPILAPRFLALTLCGALTASLLTGCAQSEQQRIAENACRAQADTVDNRINRADMAQRDTSTTPFSAQGLPGINTAPLVERSVHDEHVADCLNDTSGTLPDSSSTSSK